MSMVTKVALGAGVCAQLVGVGTALAAAVGGSSSGGAIAFVGFGLTLLVAVVALLISLFGAFSGAERAEKRWAWWGLGLALSAPVVAAGLIIALVPASAFRI